MHLGGTPSWRVGYGSSLAVDFALFIRDTLALSVDTRPHVPSLEPVLPVAVPDGVDRAAIEAEWPGWWDDVLEWAREEVPAQQALTMAPMVETAPALANRPALRAAVAALTVPAARYHAEVSKTFVSSPLPINDVVQSVERELGRPVRPFSLVITQVRVSEPMWEPLTETHVLASHRFTDSNAVVPALHEIISPLA
ncbi:hypothetical protein DMH04_06825 [Kibdelosporangium aridum]|uniref:Uncharacterized protein n=1 Tax=Kibdelosporangium aridum TaxID=2030 RepID=A0A428ZNR0_KIBAR|nr:hypothetical protein [Kibdelosporangium aridum]RSM89677.1 hypothetical protein DMH04_06825 [Kibdelosporangium aridum]